MRLFRSLIICSILTSAALAQSIEIGAPLPGMTVKAGSKITVEVDRPLTLTGSTEVAIVIGFLNCFSPAPCPSPMDRIGSILYKGRYNPQFHNVTGHKPPHQNFTVTIPRSASAGKAQLSVIHLNLIGAGPFPFLESRNLTLMVK
ncbi:hypothetical protein DFH09DRAFT_987594 [Mycena vulgaris]|nr:hypothetical protein DFH09DRAFT_987594 [Mycena vulgaris]